MATLFRRALLFAVVSSLAACGGGGGSGGGDDGASGSGGSGISNGSGSGSGSGTDNGGNSGTGNDGGNGADGGTGNDGGNGGDSGTGNDGGGDVENGGGGSAPSPVISLNQTSVTLTQESPSHTLLATFRGSDLTVSLLPGTTGPNWLGVYVPTGSVSPATVRLSMLQWLPPGRYATTLRFATSNSDGSNAGFQDVNVTYTADHVLTPSKLSPSITAGAIGPSSLPTLSLVTDGAHWEATSDQSWLTVTPASGIGSATLNAVVNSSLAPGHYTATITVRDTLTQRTRATSLDLAVNPRRLTVLTRGVALTSTAAVAVLARTVKIVDTANLGGRWIASDDAAWLQLMPSSDGSALTLTADDTGLVDGIHYATITIAPDAEPGLNNTTQIRVGLYVDHTSPAPPAELVTNNILSADATVADPIRPYVYVAQTIYGPSNAITGAISTFNFYTGQLVEQLQFPGRRMTALAVSPDGGLLIAADSANNLDAADRYLIPIELNGSARTPRPRWGGVRLDSISSALMITQIGGAAVVLTGEKQIVSIDNGAVLGEFESDEVGARAVTGKIAVSADGSAAILQGKTLGNHRLARYRLTHLGNTFRALETHNINESGEGEDVASDPAGAYFLTLSSTSNALRAYDIDTLSLIKSEQARFDISGSLDVAANSDIYVTGRLGTFVQYDPDFMERGTRTLSGSSEIAYNGRVSADGKRSVVVTQSTAVPSNAHLHFFDAPLPP